MALTRLGVGGMAGAMLLASASSAPAGVTIETIALTRTDGPFGPGMGEEIVFDHPAVAGQSRTFDTPVLDHLGNIAFSANLKGPGVTTGTDECIWMVHRNGGIAAIREGDPVPGADGLWIGAIPSFTTSPLGIVPPVISNGRVVAGPFVTGDGVDSSNDRALVLSDGSAASIILREGQPAVTGFPGTYFGTIPTLSTSSIAFAPLRLSPDGVVQVRMAATDPDGPVVSLDGLWSATSDDAPFLIIGDELPIPGIDGAFVTSVSSSHALAGAGVAAYAVQFDGESAGFASIFSGPSGMQLMAQTNDPVPGALNSTFFDFGVHGINDAGQVLVFSETRTNGMFDIAHSLWWRWDQGRIQPIVQEQVDLPVGTPLGYAKMNAVGTVVFQLGDFGPLYIWDGRETTHVLGPSWPAPNGGTLSALGIPCINRHGQIALGAEIDVGDFNENEGLYGILLVRDPDGTTHEVVRSGDVYEVQPGDLRTIDQIYFNNDSGGQDGQRMSFNDRGELVFKLVFTGGSAGIFRATIDPPVCAGDVNGDFLVDVDDLNIVLSSWNTSVPPGTSGDINEDGAVDVDDLNIVLGAWNTPCP